MRASPRTRLWRWGGGVLGVAVVAMVAIHLPLVRRALVARGQTGGALCPFGYGNPTAATREAQHQHLAALRGAAPAHARPALGFALDTTTTADLERWAHDHGVACETKHGGALVECAQVPAAIVPCAGASSLGLTSVWFELGSRGTLASIKTVRRDHAVAPVAAAFASIEGALTDQAGAPAHADGSAAPEVLANGTLRQAMVEYRFTDYRAVVRATNMGDGFVLTEEYATLVD